MGSCDQWEIRDAVRMLDSKLLLIKDHIDTGDLSLASYVVERAREDVARLLRLVVPDG